MNTFDTRFANASRSTVNSWACATLLVCVSLGLVAASLWAVTKFDHLLSLGCPPWLTMALAIAGVVVASAAAKEAVVLINDRLLVSPEEQRAVLEAAAQYPAVAEMLRARYPDGGAVSRRDCRRIAEFVRGMVDVGSYASFRAAQAPAAELPPFDYDRASRRSFAFVHEDGDTVDLAVGRPNWMPVPVAMLLAGNHDAGLQAISEAFDRYFQVELSVEAIRGRLGANSDLGAEHAWLVQSMKKLAPEVNRMMGKDHTRRFADFDPEEEQAGYSGFTLVEAVDAFLTTWQRTNVHPMYEWYAVSDRQLAYSRIPEVQALANAIEGMRICSLKWACSWLAESGMQVNHQEQLVLVPGYQPLRLKKTVYGD